MASLPQHSPDRRWRWDGQQWLKAERPGLLWFTKDPDWMGKVVLMSLLGLVPGFGLLFSIGWLLATRDSLRAGDWRVPKASFGYWRRGVYFFFTFIFYFLAWMVLVLLIFLAGALLAKTGHSPVGADVFWLIAILFLMVLAGLFCYTFGAVIAIADGRGIWATFRPQLVWRTATGSSGASWRFLGTYLLGGLTLAAISAFLPVVGALAALLLASAVFLAMAPALAAIKLPGQS
jgi:hypothetical protein